MTYESEILVCSNVCQQQITLLQTSVVFALAEVRDVSTVVTLVLVEDKPLLASSTRRFNAKFCRVDTVIEPAA